MSETHPLQLSDLRPGAQFRQYRLLEQIGAGGQGVVWSAHDEGAERIVAIKLNEIPNSDLRKAEDQIFERQAGRLVKLRHANILPMYDYGLVAPLRYLVTPYIPGMSLEDRLNEDALSVSQTLRFAADIASALDYLHTQNVVHRDLKPANILIDMSQNVYVADFGLARILSLSTQAMHTGRGTPPYASPEQHSMLEIAPQSDLYSFGVMLYEMFTRQLPWKGEKILGIQQLNNANAEIPDPTLIDATLPAELAGVLRRLTATDPAARPASSAEAMQALYAIFQTAPVRLGGGEFQDESARQDDNAERILKNGLQYWKPEHVTAILSLTKFAYVELREKRAVEQNTSAHARELILHSALTFGYEDDYWWFRVTDPKERLLLAGQLIDRDNRVVSARVIRHLVTDPEIRRLKFHLPESIAKHLLELATGTDDPSLRQQVIQFLRNFIPSGSDWRPNAFGREQDVLLAQLALEETELGNEAARLIGQLRSKVALETILKNADVERRTDVLLNIQQTAGGLPDLVPWKMRAGIFGEWSAHRLAAELPGLTLAAVLIFVGAALSAGLQVYLTYRLPNFMDMERITVSVERGIFLGAAIGLGILGMKTIVEGFPETNRVLRLASACVAGAAMLGVSLFIYDTLFLETVPQGWLLPAGCLILAAGYTGAGLVASRVGKMLVSYAAGVVALALTWFVHVTLSALPTALSPIFFYEYTWPVSQVLGTILVVAMPMAILAHVASLAPREE